MRRRLTSKVYESINTTYLFLPRKAQNGGFFLLYQVHHKFILLCLPVWLNSFIRFASFRYFTCKNRVETEVTSSTQVCGFQATSVWNTHTVSTRWLVFLIRGEEMSVYIILVKGTGQIEKKLAQCQIGAALLLDAQERRASKLVVVWLLSGIVPSFYHPKCTNRANSKSKAATRCPAHHAPSPRGFHYYTPSYFTRLTFN